MERARASERIQGVAEIFLAVSCSRGSSTKRSSFFCPEKVFLVALTTQWQLFPCQPTPARGTATTPRHRRRRPRGGVKSEQRRWWWSCPRRRDTWKRTRRGCFFVVPLLRLLLFPSVRRLSLSLATTIDDPLSALPVPALPWPSGRVTLS